MSMYTIFCQFISMMDTVFAGLQIVETYDKSAQTDAPDPSLSLDDSFLGPAPAFGAVGSPLTGHRTSHGRRDSAGANSSSTPAAATAGTSPPLADGPRDGATAGTAATLALAPNTLTPAEISATLASPAFGAFFNRASLLVERLLHHDGAGGRSALGGAGRLSGGSAVVRADPFANYAADDDGDDALAVAARAHDLVTPRVALLDVARAAARPVTAIDWSPKHEELLLASYGDRSAVVGGGWGATDPDGCVLVWNLNLPTRPEFHFYCQSPVLTAMFHPLHPKLIVGGTYSGQLVLWDTREKATPVNRTAISQGHTHPVYAMNFPPSGQKAATLVSASSDGKLCTWNSDVLVDPLSEIDLRDEKDEKIEVNATCLAFTGRDSAAVVLGADDGKVYKARLYDPPGVYESLRVHEGPVTALDGHPFTKEGAFGAGSSSSAADLYLTASCDWTIKLWSHKLARPLFRFEGAQDYVADVKWSPTHPAVFASVDGGGHMALWHLTRDVELPVARLVVGAPAGAASGALGGSGSGGGSGPGLARCRWSRNGAHLAVGDSSGGLHVFDVAHEVCGFFW